MRKDILPSLFLDLLLLLILSSGVLCSLSKMPTSRPFPISLLGNSPSKPECSFPRLKDRLVRMINYNEPIAFEIILHSECRGDIDTLNPKYMEVFRLILRLASQRNMTAFLDSIMKGDAYAAYMFTTWTVHRPLLPVNYLHIMKNRSKNPEGPLIFHLSIDYPIHSEERHFLNVWLLELQKSTLKWPFAFEPASPPPLSSPPKLKSLKSRDMRSNQFKGTETNEETKNSCDSKAAASVSTRDAELLQVPAALSPPVASNPLKFGHIYGWISRKGNPIVRNSNEVFNFYGHTVKLHDTFLGFASNKFDLAEYASSAHSSKSFFIKRNSALSQKIRTKSGKNFAVCRLVSSKEPNGGFEIEAIVKGDLTFVVLGALPSTGTYDYKYPPPSNSYDELIRGSKKLRAITVPISSSDIVFFLPRTLFNNPDCSILPHDVPGAFHYTDLSTFANSFVQFINFVHLKTCHRGLIAVGGYLHESLPKI